MIRWWRPLLTKMFRRLFVAVLLFAAAAFAEPAPAVTPPLVFSQMEQMVTTLSEITGWPVKRKVPSEILSKDKFQHYLSSHIKDSSHDKETRAEELALKMFGLVPQDFNLGRETGDLLGEQAAAFYDYRKKRLYIIDSTPPGEEQQMALVHELAHALADQQHPLGKYLNQGSPDSDASTAREAVMEGQATWLTWAYEAKRSGGKGEVPLRLLDQLTQENGDNAEFPVLDKTPLYMRESLLFPYNQGARFQDAVYRRMGRDAFRGGLRASPGQHATDSSSHGLFRQDRASSPSSRWASTRSSASSKPASSAASWKARWANSTTLSCCANTWASTTAPKRPAIGAAAHFASTKIKRTAIRCSPTSRSGIRRNPLPPTSRSTSACSRENGRKWTSHRRPPRRFPAPAIPAASRYGFPARPSNPWKV